MAASGRTDEPYLVSVIKAEHVFQVTGHPVWPWEVDEIPVDQMDAIIAYRVDYRKKVQERERREAERMKKRYGHKH